MKDSVNFGPNQTPTQTKPILTAEMVAGNKEFPPHVEDSTYSAFQLRADYILNSEPLSTVPLPGSIKGAVKSGLQAVKGNSPAVLVDKLGERLAYERTGVRLYDAFLTKCRALHPEMDLSLIENIRSEEMEHFQIIKECIIKLGADPTAQTPCADMNGMAAQGLLQVMNDPRSDIPQSVEVLMMAELIDVAAWDLLITLTREAGLNDQVKKFQQAKVAEDRHLEIVQGWLEQLVLKNEALPPQSLSSSLS